MNKEIKGCLTLVVAFVLWPLFIWLMMWAWNCLMPHILGLPTINYVQAFALVVVLGSIQHTLGFMMGRLGVIKEHLEK